MPEIYNPVGEFDSYVPIGFPLQPLLGLELLTGAVMFTAPGSISKLSKIKNEGNSLLKTLPFRYKPSFGLNRWILNRNEPKEILKML